MKKKLIALLSAAALVLVGVVSLITYANGAEDRAFKGAELVEVLVVKSEIPAQTPAGRITSAVELKKVPASVKADGALTDLDGVKDLATNTNLVPGEQVLRERFGAVAGKTKSSALPPGMQEVSISVSAPRTPNGKVKAGDKVGIVASYAAKGGDGGYTNIIQNDMLVTHVSESVVGKATGEDAGVPMIVTFAVKPMDIERIVNAAEFGKVWLTAQNPQTDTDGSKLIHSKDVIK
ncbi:Flp pilus assembly protein CpaB [Aeromicrobium sp. 9AM]|uniref:Flp pilus assembly protein CpaB n=1 Tax=Aeromicrobium sp. 9AM TaxID=2653126 RepID=UPI0012F048A3|nr:RcpC/CpaB family pilus assembly protein [Aeromicrobium sp. 9AM]VXB69271.1 conserved exported hypothetical protein [Aeromicrobium sp. 9AM]